MDYKVIVAGKKGTFDLTPFCIGNVVFTTYKTGIPSSLVFTVGRNIGGNFSFFEGDSVQFFCGDKLLFLGYIFSKERNSEHFISVLSYDQLRYLKNRDTYNYSFKTASDVLLMIVNNFKLNYSQIDDSKYVISSRIEENKTLFDIILNAVDLTYKNTGNYFVLFDDAGYICFKNQNNLVLPDNISVNSSNILDFTSKTDIDSDTFSRVKLFTSNKTKKIYKSFVAESEEAVDNFGVLQYFEKMPDEYNDFQLKNCAESILKEKNRIKRSFNIKCIGLGNGEQIIRAGNSILINNLDIGDEILYDWKVILKCIHYFKSDEHIFHLFF